MEKEDAYSQAVASGLYVRESGLHGKYDNVRLYWEDEVTRLFIRPHLEGLLRRRFGRGKGARIIDLGCGSGDGFELLMQMARSDVGLGESEMRLIPQERLEHLRGIEINYDLLNQNAERWGEDPGMACMWGDFSQGLPVEEGDPSFDIYLTSYGALSHLDEDQTVRLFSDIAEHAEDGSLLVGDWLGRYSYEWQQLWDADASREQWMDYVISYIYPEGPPRDVELASLTLRLLSREEVMRVVERVEADTGIRLEVKGIFDRSVFVGRHMDTCDYNPYLKPLRRAVNSLLERNVRTDLERLLMDYRPHSDVALPDRFFEQFQPCWNALVRHTMALCGGRSGADTEIPSVAPRSVAALKTARERMEGIVAQIDRVDLGDPRANVIEPQLGYALRGLEMALQQGAGNGHGLVGVFTVSKPS